MTRVLTCNNRHACVLCVPHTVCLQVALSADRDLVAARIVKGRLERTTLGQVARDISLQFKPGGGGTGSL